MIVLLFFGSIQLISLGVLGEYVGKIYVGAKRRPSYILRETNLFPLHENAQERRK